MTLPGARWSSPLHIVRCRCPLPGDADCCCADWLADLTVPGCTRLRLLLILPPLRLLPV